MWKRARLRVFLIMLAYKMMRLFFRLMELIVRKAYRNYSYSRWSVILMFI